MNTPTSFVDPDSYPIIFKPRMPVYIAFGQNSYSITFKFDSEPRQASILAFAVDQKDSLLIDRDIWNDSSVGLFSKDTSHRFELYAESKNIEEAGFYIKAITSSMEPIILNEGNVVHIRQSESQSNISHTFSMEPSTQLFDSVSGLYPTASLDLSFSGRLRNNGTTWNPISLSDKTETPVLIKPAGVSGILDILAKLRLEWYTDESRTNPYYGIAPITRNESFGIRFYISSPGLFVNKIQYKDNGNAVVEDMLPQSTLTRLGYSDADAIYFGGGSRTNDLFTGIESGIEIGENGLPLQDGVSVPVYLLNNELEDIYSSSSSISSSSESSLSSSSISSFSSSSVSSSSKSSISSKSSSSKSSQSSISSDSSESSLSSSSVGPSDNIAQFDFTSVPYLQVTSKNANITVTDMALGRPDGMGGTTVETNITTGTYFPNEPYIEETGGWEKTNQASSKYFFFTITPAVGYKLNISRITFNAYAAGTGPSAFSFEIGSGLATYTTNAPDASLVVIDQSIDTVRNQTGAVTVKIQGWLNGSRTTTGAGAFRIDDVTIYGHVELIP